MPQFEKITAADVNEGDIIRTPGSGRDSLPLRVLAIKDNETTRWIAIAVERDYTHRGKWPHLAGEDFGNIRPRHTTKLWREVQS